MSSSVHFKFKSQKEPSRVTFDGTSISVFDLKREIITINRLGDGSDFELSIYNENDNSEYDDDTTLIPRSTSVIARRLPAIRPGRGGAARYVSGKAPINAKLAARDAQANAKARGADMNSAMTEDERISAMFSLQGEQWNLKQQEMATEHRVPLTNSGPGKGFPKKNANIPEGEPPRGYVCYRCAQKGHWIQACPTNDDPNFENKARLKRITGIPRSMLKTIDKSEFDNLDEARQQQIMLTQAGEYVIAQTDEKEWQRHQEKAKASAAAHETAQKGDQELQSRGLECPIDKRLFVDPVKTPCCQRNYCNECISTALIDSDLTCPGCSTENVTLEELVPDEEMQKRVDAYKAEKVAEKEEQQSKSAAASPTAKSAEDRRSPSTSSADGKGTPQKRGADSMSDSKNLAPEAPQMKRQRSGQNSPDKPSSPSKTDVATIPEASAAPTLPLNQFMPPDMSQMRQNMANFPMAMPGMPFMPNMNMMMPQMMPMMPMGNFMPPNFNMNGMNGMNGMNSMNGMGSMNGMNGMGGMNGGNGMNFNGMGGGLANNFHQPGPNNNNNFPRNGNNNQNNYAGPNQSNNKAMPGVPTGPRNPNVSGGTNMANKFSNQQRPLGKDEDNAYMRQPVNPHRHQNRPRRARPSDYREL